ncbi:D-hexose-6-phosphate mutarotase [Cryobacterium algoritolerans]|uniref:D-hexose-6-phosphate mutarotase n=1 Tax=Cryobacterium algoritolerans TaxID=1259184 RepID=UPI00141B1D77|nr:D-hexose-6-phosphate mutarotase [Cryobacterium algoritolerans]
MSPAPFDPAVLPASVRLATGRGGLPVVRVAGQHGSAELYLHGAHLVAWTPFAGRPVLWLSEAGVFTEAKAIRGGVPICFPWFGANRLDPVAPAHGFARLAEWELVGARDDGQAVAVTLRLSDSPATRATAWPHRFEALYTVTVGARLTLALTVTNRDTDAVGFEEALHSYLAVDDIRATEIGGLEGAPYLDQLHGMSVETETGPVRFTAETDRIYLDSPAATIVTDGSRRTVSIATGGSRSTIVWNPWIAKAASMGDFGDDEWTGMVCVESANVRENRVQLEPGESHTLTAVFDVAG